MDERRQKSVSAEGLWLAFSNMTLGVLFGFFAYAHAFSYLRFFRPSVLLIVVKESLDATFFLIRRAPLKTNHSVYPWVIAIAGTFSPFFFRPTENPTDFWFGQAVQVLGLMMQIVAILSLSRSFGLVAANRGIKTGGLYRIVRHPLYITYFVGQSGYLMNNLSTANCLILVVATGFQVLRLFSEEAFLKEDAVYVSYKKQTKWRLIPYVF